MQTIRETWLIFRRSLVLTLRQPVWLLMGIIEPSAGRVTIDVGGIAKPPSALVGRVAYLPQQPYFEELQTVYDAIHFVAPDAADEDIVSLVSRLFDERYVGSVSGLLEKTVMSLSMGERRIIALARVLLRKSALVILDEPEANLDPQLRQSVMSVLREAKLQSRMLLVTHDDAIASIADRIYRMPEKRTG